MKKMCFAVGALGVAVVANFYVAIPAPAMITCPAGSHTFSGGTQASGYDLCIPDVGASGPVSGGSSQTSGTFTPSNKGTVTPGGTTSETQTQGMALDSQVSSEVNRLYGTSIYAQAKALYDASVTANRNDFNSVVSQVNGMDPYAADPYKLAYNVRAIGRLNQVWTQIMALEASYAQQQAAPTAVSPTPVSPTLVVPTQVMPTPVNPTPINPTTITPTPINPTQILPTSINPTTINPTQVTPSPINPTTLVPTPVTPTPITARYYNATDLAPGQTVSAPADLPASITKPDQSIFMRAGSAIKYVDQNVWQTLGGVFRFIEKTAIDGRFKIRTNGGAVVAVRGTELIIDEAGDTTTLTLLKGLVTVKSAKSNATVTVKPGYSLTIKNGVPGKPVKTEAAKLDKSWYADIAPSETFTSAAWQKTSAAGNWSDVCTITAGQSVASETLTADEQSALDYINQASTVFSVQETDIFAAANKISVARKKTTANNGTQTMSVVINGKSLHYSGDGKVWKVFQEKDLIASMLDSAKSHNIVYGIDRSTMTFDHWELDASGANRLAVYKAVATRDGTDSLIHNAFSSEAPSAPETARGYVYVDEETQRWVMTATRIDYPTGKIVMPIYQTCKYAYDTAKIKVPARSKSVTSAVGITEMQQIYNAAQ